MFDVCLSHFCLIRRTDGVTLCTVAAIQSISGSRTQKIAAFSLPMTAVPYVISLKQHHPERKHTFSRFVTIAPRELRFWILDFGFWILD
jgi:hypothetical protein